MATGAANETGNAWRWRMPIGDLRRLVYLADEEVGSKLEGVFYQVWHRKAQGSARDAPRRSTPRIAFE